jgi:c(7)-type cytochrome triheme protein
MSLSKRVVRTASRATRRLAAVLVATGLSLVACTVPPRVAGILFEPAPAPKPVVHPLRREPYKPPAPVKVEVASAEPQVDWAGIYAQLPTGADSNVDWAKALQQELIRPKPGTDEKAEEQPVLDLDVELVPKDLPEFKVVYPHRVHTQVLGCTNCHTGIFQMEEGADPITMEKILGGEYCGRCHGKVSFDTTTNCVRCHKGMPQ